MPELFNFQVFASALLHLCKIGIISNRLYEDEFKENRFKLVHELSNFGVEVHTAFERVLSDRFIKNLPRNMVRPFNDGFCDYALNFMRNASTQPVTVQNNMKMGRIAFIDVIKSTPDNDDARAVASVPLILEKITIAYLNTPDL